MFRNFWSLAIVASTMLVSANIALGSPILVTFSPTEGYGGSVTNQLSLVISEDGDEHLIKFSFKNNVGIASHLAEIYLSDGLLFGTSPNPTNIVQTGTGYVFSTPAPPTPGGGIDNWTSTTQFFSADVDAQKGLGNGDGLNAADDLFEFTLALINGQTISDVLAALQNTDPDSTDPKLRIAFHVRSIGDYAGGSQWFENNVPNSTATPEPGTFALLALGGVGIAAFRRKKKVVAA